MTTAIVMGLGNAPSKLGRPERTGEPHATYVFIQFDRAVLAAVVGCDRGGTTALAPRLAQGRYGLESTSGRGAAAGTVVLSVDGTAERRARYTQPGGGVSAEYVARGTFQVGAGGMVDLQLREDDGRSSYVWRPRAVLIGAVLQLRYPDPGDGPDIVESYRRQ